MYSGTATVISDVSALLVFPELSSIYGDLIKVEPRPLAAIVKYKSK